MELFNEEKNVFCPLCGFYFRGSEYLATVFQEKETLWLANMVTHYRHTHINHWNRMWGPYGNRYRSAFDYNDDFYQEAKAKVNEQAKRQIIRKACDFLNKNGITSTHFERLKGTTAQTMDLVKKKLTE